MVKDKIKEIYHKHIDWVVFILLVLFMSKSCQSCQRSRQIKFYEQSAGTIIDSLQDNLIKDKYVIDSLVGEIRLGKTTIQSLNSELLLVKDENKLLRESNKHYKQTNKKLIDNISVEN